MIEPFIEQLLSDTLIVSDRIRKKYIPRHVGIKSQGLSDGLVSGFRIVLLGRARN